MNVKRIEHFGTQFRSLRKPMLQVCVILCHLNKLSFKHTASGLLAILYDLTCVVLGIDFIYILWSLLPILNTMSL